ncbi:recombinase family protein [Rufibacter latericius]|uniref:Recombinase family protein n=2 Tax=Rufibacter latericius TaxID=2487040 RepID=A0A3M9MEP3_9BACT|nr:recombinase family protein [Rufibacter latericius]
MKAIEYYRVSTQRQGNSGLGLEAQEAAVQAYLVSVGAVSIARFVEIETGGNKDRISAGASPNLSTLLRKRPVLQEAIRLAQKEEATILVKEASRLTRFSLLMNYLIASNIRFRAAANPNDDALMLRIKTALNEEELIKVSERTIAALSSRKKRGLSLGNAANFTDQSRKLGSRKMKEMARQNIENYKLTKIILADRRQGMTLQQIADELNRNGVTTVRGKKFYPATIKMYLARAEQPEPLAGRQEA